MVEFALNAIWIAIAAGAVAAIPRCTPRTRIALICAVALLFPIISITDDFNSDLRTLDVAAIAVTFAMAILFVAMSRVQAVSEPFYAIALATPSDPRSPPR